MLHLVKEIISAKPYILSLKFNTGEVKEINLEPSLKRWSKSSNSKFKELLNPDTFSAVKLNPEMQTIYWDNGIDFCPDMLYEMGKIH